MGFDSNGTPHLRIEHRVMAAGPSVPDTIANAALFYGLVHFYGEQAVPPEALLPFERCRENFYAAAQAGLMAKVVWLDGKSVVLRQLLLEELLPLARRGLERLDIKRDDIETYLGMIEARVMPRLPWLFDGTLNLGDNMTTFPPKISETEYWEKYYDGQEAVYELNNGYLEEKGESDVLTISMYKWFLELLEHYFRSNPIAQSVLLEMGFQLSGKNEVRRPDLGIVLNDNPIPLLPHDKSYHGIYDMCIEALSDSTTEIMERDTITKKDEYAQAGVKEYYILDSRRERTQFFRLNARSVYTPIKPLKGGIIKSKVLPGFQFRFEDLFTKPSPDEMINDKVYQDFVLPGYLKEKQARQAEERARQKAEQRAEQLAARLRSLGIDPDQVH
ncbi:MAG: Uma2 family endonuclease [Pseudomonadota bacterium]